MTLLQFALMALQFSILVAVFGLGLSTTRGALVSLIARPWLMLRSLFAIYVVMLILAVVLVKALHLPYAAGIALIGLALAPMPPVMPNSMIKAGGEAEYASALLVTASLLSVVWIPLAVHWLAVYFGIDVGAAPTGVIKTVLITITVPLILGALTARLLPGLAARLKGPMSAIGGLAVSLATLLVVIATWGGITDQVGHGALVAIVIFAVVGLLVGHLLGGPLPEDRTVLALACAVRHPGVVAAIGGMVAPNAGVALAALLALLVCTICTLPYIAWRKRVSAAESIL